jgi:hypothetical protein
MSATASITFTFDGTRESFDHVYEVACRGVRDVALDIGTYFEGTTGAIDFMVDDYAAFEEKIAEVSAELGVRLRPSNALSFDQKA